ncbi:MAG: 30S ribosomal protein S20 [Vulcanimicrobiaceae bacterium]
MPNIKSAAKWVRQSAKRKVRNLDTKTRLKTLFKKSVDQQSDDTLSREVASEFDKAAKRGVIHKNKAARKKSRLAKAQAAKAKAAATAPAKPAKRTAKKTSAKK